MSFFIKSKKNINDNKYKIHKSINKNDSKREKRQLGSTSKRKERDVDEEITSEEDDDDVSTKNFSKQTVNNEVDSEIAESSQAKRLRLAKIYLEEIEKQEKLKRGDDDNGDVVGDKLLETTGKLKKCIADSYNSSDTETVKILKAKEHNLSITCMALSFDGNFLFSASKDSGIVKWDVLNKVKLKGIKGNQKSPEGGHVHKINCISLTSDNKFLATGDDGGIIIIWNFNLEKLKVFKKHSKAVTGLAFRLHSHQLFSCSGDRTVKIWSLDEMAYIETLFGHQSGITSIDVLTMERAVTSGGFDNTLRVWKLIEESQLIYNGHKASIDCVRLITEEYFVSGGEDGLLCMWGIMKKKPLCVVENAHGLNEENGQPNWIVSIASILYSDLIASGSQDGHVRLWKCGNHYQTLMLLFSIPVIGFINSIMFTPDGSNLFVATGQEHKSGRWFKVKDVKNQIIQIALRKE